MLLLGVVIRRTRHPLRAVRETVLPQEIPHAEAPCGGSGVRVRAHHRQARAGATTYRCDREGLGKTVGLTECDKRATVQAMIENEPGDGVDRGLGIWQWVERDHRWAWVPWSEAR